MMNNYTLSNSDLNVKISKNQIKFGTMVKSDQTEFVVDHQNGLYLAEKVMTESGNVCLKARFNNGTVFAFIEHIHLDYFGIHKILKS